MRRLMLALCAVSLLGCGGSDSTGLGGDVVGTWELTTVNGSGLPFTLVQIATPPYRLEILGDVIIYNDNGTWTATTTFRENDDGTITEGPESGNGTWSQTSASITTMYPDGSSSRATISGDRLTFADGGLTAVYERR